MSCTGPDRLPSALAASAARRPPRMHVPDPKLQVVADENGNGSALQEGAAKADGAGDAAVPEANGVTADDTAEADGGEDGGEDGASAAEKKKKKRNRKKKKKKAEAAEDQGPPPDQTDPPSIPIARYFPSRVFPVGELQDYVDANAYRTSSEELRERERIEEDLYNSVREAAEVHRRVRRYMKPHIQPGARMIDICERLEDANRAMVGAVDGDLSRGIAFPTGCSLNHVAAHWTPNKGDTTVLGKDDVVKMDFGYVRACGRCTGEGARRPHARRLFGFTLWSCGLLFLGHVADLTLRLIALDLLPLLVRFVCIFYALFLFFQDADQWTHH